ncbi:metallophosphoesterase [Streptomyces sp. Caat 7-52]|uniref:metallophosphoesterase family protein n=1 Tax=Streptomyces sp. Caat 7-52 TaxID=2949637 RepID=UPI0020352D0F|nr:metallophosphoesterase [Streptomyces sp. Caat 7-52]
MSPYRPSRSYEQDLDIRFHDGQVPAWAHPLVDGVAPNDACWLVVMPRRSGKSWLASAVKQARPEGRTKVVDVRSEADVRRTGLTCLTSGKAQRPQLGDVQVVLVDEPAVGPSSGRTEAPATLAAGLTRLRDEDVVPVVFATPAEYELLVPHLGVDAVKDRLTAPPLTDEEAGRMAARTPEWAPGVVARLRAEQPGWLLTPFLLELVLQTAEAEPGLRDDPAALSRRAAEAAAFPHLYVNQLFHNGLSAAHRAALRRERWRGAGLSFGSDDRDARTMKVLPPVAEDPVLAHHLPEVLRIHHVSDLHVGGRHRTNVDQKDRTQLGSALARLTGDGSPLTGYLEHVRHLAEQGRAPHLVIASGDLVDRPVDAHGQEALDWLARLADLLAGHPDLRADDPRVLLVGGNHDVSWDRCLDERPGARHEWFADTFRAYPHPELDKEDYDTRRLYVRYADAGLRVALLGSAESGGEPVRNEDRDRVRLLLAELARPADGTDISELMGRLERYDPGVVAHGVLRRLKKETGCVNLAVVHHPLSPVPSVEVAPYAGVVNAGQAKLALADADTALVLHGHTHLGFLASERLIDRDQDRPWTTRIAGAPALASIHSNEENGYNEVYVAREGEDHSVAVRTVRWRNGQWKPDLAIAFRPGAADECAFDELGTDRGVRH